MEPAAHPAGQDGGPMVVPQMQSPSGQGEKLRLNDLQVVYSNVSILLSVCTIGSDHGNI